MASILIFFNIISIALQDFYSILLFILTRVYHYFCWQFFCIIKLYLNFDVINLITEQWIHILNIIHLEQYFKFYYLTYNLWEPG
jgi:hypothetical protein